MALGAKVDERCFQTGFDAGDAGAIDVSLFLFAGTRLNVEVVEALAIYERNAQLFGLGCVDENPFHDVSLTLSSWYQSPESRRTV